MKVSKEDLERATHSLKAVIKPNSVIYGIIRSQSASGSASISPVVIHQGEPLHPAWAIAVVTGFRFVEKNGYNALRMNGYGYNRIDAIAEAVGLALYGPGHKITGRYI